MVDVRTNLLKNRHTLTEKEYERERSLLKSSVVTIVVIVVIVIALSVWNLVLTRKLSSIESALTLSSTEMQGLSLASAQQIYLKSRLNMVTEFLASRGIERESFQRIFSTNIEGVHVGAVSFEGEDLLSINYIASSALAVDKLTAYYQRDTGYFTQAVTTGLSRSKDGNYQINVTLSLPKGNK